MKRVAVLKKKPKSAKKVADRTPSPRNSEKNSKNIENSRKVRVTMPNLAKKSMTKRLAGCVPPKFPQNKDLADAVRQRTFAARKAAAPPARTLGLGRAKNACPSESKKVRLTRKMRVLRQRSDEVVPANEGSRLGLDPPMPRREQAPQRGPGLARPARRGQRRTRSVLTSRCPSMRKRAETFVKNCCGRTQE